MSKKGYFRLIFFIIIILISIKIIDNYTFFFSIISKFFSLLSPLFWGIGIAYILNPLMIIIEKKFPTFKRIISLLIVYTVFLAILVIFSIFVGPKIVQNVIDLTDKLPKYWNQSINYASELMSDFSLSTGVDLSFLNINENILSRVIEFFNTTFNQVFFTALNFTRGIMTFVLGIFVSVYLLFSKENFLNRMRKNVLAFLGEEKSEIIFKYATKINLIFKNFLVGKFIDSVIVGIICFIGLSLLKVNYAFLLSLIVGITNMIPYFGPMIGAVPAIIITLFFSPIQALWVAIFILALQQFDGWYLGPTILGETVGVSPLSIIFAILIGGGFFGPLGMLLAVPVLKSIAIIWEDFIERKIQQTDENKEKQQLSNINININFGNKDEN